MKRNKSIKLKAAFLLIVFSLNTVIGFACAIGMDMGFNNKHHHDDEEAMETSVPANGKELRHHNKENKHHHNNDEEAMETSVPVKGKEHQHHDEEGKHHHDTDKEAVEIPVPVNGKEHQHHNKESKHHHDSKEDSEKSDCCNDGVIMFQNLEKNLNLNNIPIIHPQLFATIVSNLWNINIFNCVKTLPQHYKARVFHPPIPDILIAIQRFQI